MCLDVSEAVWINRNRASLVLNLGMQSVAVFSGRTDGIAFIRTLFLGHCAVCIPITDTTRLVRTFA
jgi:hypothetical protein